VVGRAWWVGRGGVGGVGRVVAARLLRGKVMGGGLGAD
jgi:hypothetical protein